jgi:lysozyme
VLDIEPTDRQISGMGGSKAMWNHIRTWLQAVERRCGVKPILYVNQRFVNKYLPDAPDIKRDYKIWIARYGEYKPDIKLVVWQLSPDGRVNGITGDVDINVFNGYRTQFDEFLTKECIK